MHPSCALIIWLAAVVGLQLVGYAGLALLVAVALVLMPALLGRWLAYVRRARLLLLTLWLILAYNTPGEAVLDLAWAPTHEGIAEANLQAARLLAMLACLAWLFVRLGHQGMVAGLWGLMQPLRALHLDVERLVVRLSLVLDHLQQPPEKGAWKRMLANQPAMEAGQATLKLHLLPWRRRDSMLVAMSGFALLGAACL